MAIKVACACGKKLAVKDELAGKKVKCPACQKLLNIPKPKAKEESLDDEWDLGDSAEEDFEDEPSDAPVKSRGGKSSPSRGAVSRKSSVKGKGKKSKSSNRGLLIGVSAGGGVLVVALLAWLLWPASPAADVAEVAGQPNDSSTGTPSTGGTPPAVATSEPRYASFSEFTDGMDKTLMAGMVSEGHSVPWTMPGDVSFDESFPSQDNTFVDGATMFADGSVRHLRVRDSILRPTYRALFTIGGKESASFLSLYPPGADTSDPTYPTPQEHVRHSEARSQNKNSLRAIALAFHNYHATFKHLPPATVFATDGKPLVSWRVLILPFLGEPGLFKEYDQSVSWDDPKNAAVLAKMPNVYRDPLSNDPQSTLTPYLVITGSGTAFPTGNAARDMPRPATSAPNSAALAGNNPATSKTAANAPASDVTGDLKALQGDWHVVEMQTDPPRPPKELETFKTVTISFVGDSMTIHIPSLASVAQPAQKIRLDSSQTPKVIDVMPPAGNVGAKQLFGIYSIENDVLKLFQSPLSRPTSFVPIKGEREGIMILHRGKAVAVPSAQRPEDKFDHKAWERVQPTLRPLGIQSQLLTRREAPESIPEGLQAVAVLVLPDLSASDRYPDNILATIKSLSHVIVKTVEMNDAKLKQLSEHPGLIGLNLSGKSVITSDGLRTLKQCPLFRHLQLEQVSLAPLDLMTMIDELNKLSSLSVNDMPVTDNLLVYLQVLKGLETLSLQNTSVTDAGTEQLAKLSSLKALLLDGSKITDQGLPSLKSLNKLTLLSVRRLNVSPQSVDELQKALPGCKILK